MQGEIRRIKSPSFFPARYRFIAAAAIRRLSDFGLLSRRQWDQGKNNRLPAAGFACARWRIFRPGQAAVMSLKDVYAKIFDDDSVFEAQALQPRVLHLSTGLQSFLKSIEQRNFYICFQSFSSLLYAITPLQAGSYNCSNKIININYKELFIFLLTLTKKKQYL